jgi:hypothetical protein
VKRNGSGKYEGSACKECGNTIRYVSGKRCVRCHRENVYRRKYPDREAPPLDDHQRAVCDAFVEQFWANGGLQPLIELIKAKSESSFEQMIAR